MSDHQVFRQNIAALAAGRLDGPERERLLEHLATCEDCAAILKAAREIVALEGRGFHQLTAHPEVLRLREFAMGGTSGDREAIERHLAHCDSCSLEVDAWQRHLARSSRPTAAVPRLAPARRLLVAAGLLAAGIAIGILVRWPGESTSRTAPGFAAQSGAFDSLIVSGALRGAEAPSQALVEAGQPVLPVIVYIEWFEAPDELGPLDVRLAKLHAEVVWSISVPTEQMTSLVTSDKPLTLLIPAETLAAGNYELTLSRPRDPAPLIQHRFELVRKREQGGE